MKQHKGFVIPLVLMLISIIIVLATGIYQRGSIFVPYMGTVMKHQQARMLALSGMQVAMSQLCSPQGLEAKKAEETAEQKKGQAKQPSPEEQAKTLLAQILPTLNQWQEFPLKKNIDGIEGTIKISISCEEGKIDLNRIYDFARRRFAGEGSPTGDWKKVMEFVCKRIQKSMEIKEDLFESFEKFFKQRQYKLNDATELLPLDAFKSFARSVFYEPPTGAKDEKSPLYLLDIFTVYGTGKLQPWLLSDSLRGILEMKRVEHSGEKNKKMMQDIVKQFKPTINLAQDWKALFQPQYGIELKRLFKGIEPFFASSFDPKIFSVVSYGVIGDMTQRLYAILERVRHVEKDKTWYDVKIRKFYWI
jgi:hypothetical protein